MHLGGGAAGTLLCGLLPQPEEQKVTLFLTFWLVEILAPENYHRIGRWEEGATAPPLNPPRVAVFFWLRRFRIPNGPRTDSERILHNPRTDPERIPNGSRATPHGLNLNMSHTTPPLTCKSNP